MTPASTFLFALCLSQGTTGWAIAFDFSIPNWGHFKFPEDFLGQIHEPPCNKECSCSNDKIDCKGKGFTAVPELTTRQHYQTWLEEIDVSYNQITRILESDLMTWRPMSFTTIKFNNNKIVQIEASAFTIFHHSEHLSLAHNMLTTFPWTALKKSSFLASLDLQSNMLASAPSSALQGLRLLLEFNIRDNRFTALPNSFFRYNKQLRRAHLGANPWRCDCDNNWLRQYMEEKEDVVQDKESIFCTMPARLEGMLVMGVPKNLFECIPPTNKVTHYPRDLSLTEGQAVFLTCNASGEEPLAVRWLGPQKKPVATPRFTDRVQVTGGKDALLLTVKHLNMEDMPGYTCESSNRGGSTSTFVPLNVSCTSSCPKSAPKPSLLVATLEDITSNQAKLTWAPQKSSNQYHLAFGKAGEKKKQETAVVKASDSGYTMQGLEPATSYTVCIDTAAPVSPTNCLSFKTKQATKKKSASSSSVNLTGAIIGGTAALSFPFVIFIVVCLYLKNRRERDAAAAAAAAAANLHQSAMWHANGKMTPSHHQGQRSPDFFTRSDMHPRNQAPHDNTNNRAPPVPGQRMEQRAHGFKPNIPPHSPSHWKMTQNNLTPVTPPRAIYEEACPVIRGKFPPPPIPRDVNISMATEDIYGRA